MTDETRAETGSPWRRRLALVIALVGVMVVGGRLSSKWPRTVLVEYRVAAGTERLEIDYLLDGEAMVSARFNFGAGETSVNHEVKLPPGRYEVSATSTLGGRSSPVVHRLVVPMEGLVTIDLRER